MRRIKRGTPPGMARAGAATAAWPLARATTASKAATSWADQAVAKLNRSIAPATATGAEIGNEKRWPPAGANADLHWHRHTQTRINFNDDSHGVSCFGARFLRTLATREKKVKTHKMRTRTRQSG